MAYDLTSLGGATTEAGVPFENAKYGTMDQSVMRFIDVGGTSTYVRTSTFWTYLDQFGAYVSTAVTTGGTWRTVASVSGSGRIAYILGAHSTSFVSDHYIRVTVDGNSRTFRFDTDRFKKPFIFWNWDVAYGGSPQGRSIYGGIENSGTYDGDNTYASNLEGTSAKWIWPPPAFVSGCRFESSFTVETTQTSTSVSNYNLSNWAGVAYVLDI